MCEVPEGSVGMTNLRVDLRAAVFHAVSLIGSGGKQGTIILASLFLT